jgi:hypothetical protein
VSEQERQGANLDLESSISQKLLEHPNDMGIGQAVFQARLAVYLDTIRLGALLELTKQERVQHTLADPERQK